MEARVVIGDLFTEPNIYWATGFLAPDPVIYIETNSNKWLLIGGFEFSRAQKQAKPDVQVVSIRQHTKDKGVPYFTALQQFLKKHKITEIIVPDKFPAVYFSKIQSSSIKIITGGRIFPERAVKTKQEIKQITEVQRAIEEVFDLAIERLMAATIKNGKIYENNIPLTSEKLRNFMDLEFYCRGYINPLGIIIASGQQAIEPHNSGSGPLIANVPIIFDIFPRSRSTFYWSDMSRTVVKGKLNPKAKSMYAAVHDAQALGISLIKEGVEMSFINKTIKDYFETSGFHTDTTPGNISGFIHGIGHGLGLEIHELPSLNSVDGELKQGHVITIEPGLYYPNIGGVRIEDTLVVTKKGSKNLAKTTKKLLEL